MKKLLTLSLVLTLALPISAYAVFTVPINATSTTQGWVFPAKVNGTEQTILGQNFVATSTTLATILQKLFFTNATGTSATTTNFAITSLLSKILYASPTGSIGGLTVGTGLTLTNGTLTATAGLPWPFTKQANNYQATSTGMTFTGGFLSVASTTVGAGGADTGLVIFGGATSTGAFLHLASTTLQAFSGINFLALGSTTLQAFSGINFTALGSTTLQAFTSQAHLALGSTTLQKYTSTEGTTTAFSVQNNFLLLGTGNAYIGSTTQRTKPFASTTPIDASGFSVSIGSTTMPLGLNREATKIVGVACQASTTAGVAGGFLLKLGTAAGTYTETVFCDTNYREYTLSTNVNIAAHIPVVGVVSKASTTPQTGWFTEFFQKTSQ